MPVIVNLFFFLSVLRTVARLAHSASKTGHIRVMCLTFYLWNYLNSAVFSQLSPNGSLFHTTTSSVSNGCVVRSFMCQQKQRHWRAPAASFIILQWWLLWTSFLWWLTRMV